MKRNNPMIDLSAENFNVCIPTAVEGMVIFIYLLSNIKTGASRILCFYDLAEREAEFLRASSLSHANDCPAGMSNLPDSPLELLGSVPFLDALMP
ncbi:hypothetical protein CDAR_573171 [Caerostris darwini]|uniref:Uncharacterized protein n=1 Tax=Caerostris darwini TaxID=1538125 RepID=A0AAV4W5H3_9ARAC|nr:hypothetical protein CDAR_573171 [Caerostris darwini]